MEVEVTPVFVLGAAHSGTTILYRMLALHPDLAWFSQFSQRDGSVPSRFTVPFCNQLDRFLRILFTHDWRKEESPVRQLLVPRPGEANQIWDYIIPERSNVPGSECVKRMRFIFKAQCQLLSKRFIIIKLPRLYEHVSLLLRAYPNARLVHIVRDGRALALSVQHKFMHGGKSETEALRAAASYWIQVLGSINAHRDRTHIFELRYEDLCADVHGWIAKVLEYTDVERASFPFHRCPATLVATNSKWLQGAKIEEVMVAEELQKEWLRQYGYITT